MKAKRIPARSFDKAGHRIVSVPLANWHLPAVLDAEDYDRLVALDFTGNWTFNRNSHGHSYVRCAHRNVTGCLVTVSRLIMTPAHGEIVRYLDGNRLNLRRDNLDVTTGRAKNREQEAVEAAESRLTATRPIKRKGVDAPPPNLYA